MTYIIHYDVCALLLAVILAVCFFYKKFTPSLTNRCFFLLLCMIIFAITADLADVVGTMHPFVFPLWYHYLTSYLFYLSLNILPAIYAFYIITLTGTQKKLLRGLHMLTFFLPLAVLLSIIVLNPIFHWLFRYDEMRNYSRGPLLYVLQSIAFYYQFYGLFYLSRFKDVVPRNKRIALSAFFPLVAIPTLIQLFFPQLLIVLLGSSFCMMLIFLTIQNPDELLSGRTGLFNYSALISQAKTAFRSGRDFYIISACIKKYDYLDDTFGDTQMTEILQEISSGLKQFVARHKELYYLKDGQFVIILPSCELTPLLPAQIQDIIEGKSRSNRMGMILSAQIHVLHCPEDVSSLDVLSSYLQFFARHRDDTPGACSANIQDAHTRIMAIERAVKNALENDGFEVYYQPIFSTKEKRINSAEALLRLYDEELGYIPPDEFIPITEQNGKIIEIGMFVFRSVCRFLAENNLERIGIDYIEINLSVEQCMQKKLAGELIQIIKDFQLPPPPTLYQSGNYGNSRCIFSGNT